MPWRHGGGRARCCLRGSSLSRTRGPLKRPSILLGYRASSRTSAARRKTTVGWLCWFPTWRLSWRSKSPQVLPLLLLARGGGLGHRSPLLFRGRAHVRRHRNQQCPKSRPLCIASHASHVHPRHSGRLLLTSCRARSARGGSVHLRRRKRTRTALSVALKVTRTW